jgi:hypothetical protein
MAIVGLRYAQRQPTFEVFKNKKSHATNLVAWDFFVPDTD